MDLEGLLPADHRARVVWEFVEGLDLTPLYGEIKAMEGHAGRPAATACQKLFADLPDVSVLHGDWRLIESHGPFDLLILDGGGGGKRENDPPADPAVLLKPGGTLVLDDFHPPMEFWPEDAAARDEYGRSTTESRKHWLQHPDLFATEVRVHPLMSAILGTRKAPRP